MDKRIADLRIGFEGYVRLFGASERFTGPSWYLHRKTLAIRAQHGDVTSLLEDDAFFDALYATLTAWGLHRMGPGNTRLRELGQIRDSIRSQATLLEELAPLDITAIGVADRSMVVEKVWSVLSALRVSVAAAQIVANSKALHQLLPMLVPPIDREYTYRFFCGRTMLSIQERAAFSEVFTRLLSVAAECSSVIGTLLGESWNTSPAKVVDNAVVGYLIAREGAASPESIFPAG